MDFWHIRQLIHSVLTPLVKFCPTELWDSWLAKLLSPLFSHCYQVLIYSWTNLTNEGRAKVPDIGGNFSSSNLQALDVEVMEEQLLRSLTREICSLLSVVASSGLNGCLPYFEQVGHANRMDLAVIDLESLAPKSLMCFLLKQNGPTFPMLQLCLEALCWPDGEAVTKLLSFCGPIILVAVSTNNPGLKGFVAKDMFSAIIRSLTLDSNAIISAELVGLCCDIFTALSNKDPACKEVLLSLPCITMHDLLAFEDALAKTSSPKEQKQHMRSLLLLATGDKLRALAAQKGAGAMTNISVRIRNPSLSMEKSSEEGGDLVGLAAIT
ncbi:unnamed protein product [Victoria cruziana]